MVDVLRSLASHEAEEVLWRSTVTRLEAGGTFDMAEARQTLFVLVSGRARVFEPNRAGRGLTLSVVEGEPSSGRRASPSGV